MNKIIIACGVVAVSCFCLFGGCSRNVEWVKSRAPEAAKQNGFEIVGYRGYQWGAFFGGMVWYTMKQDGITYEAGFAKWGNEVHIYNLKALNAISP